MEARRGSGDCRLRIPPMKVARITPSDTAVEPTTSSRSWNQTTCVHQRRDATRERATEARDQLLLLPGLLFLAGAHQQDRSCRNFPHDTQNRKSCVGRIGALPISMTTVQGLVQVLGSSKVISRRNLLASTRVKRSVIL